MAAKPLPSQTFLCECFTYDRETGSLTWRERPSHHFRSEGVQIRWNTKHRRKRADDITPDGRYRRVGLMKSRWMVHRLIWRMETGEDAPQVDHRNCDGLDNRFDNLRASDHNTNVLNQRGWGGRDLPKGVSRKGKKYLAQIQFQKKSYRLGVHDTPEQARAVYIEAAHRLHGKFANEGVSSDARHR